MKIYLVGGAVRDELLGFSIKEKDWVVVGSTPEEMKAKNSFKSERIFLFFYIQKQKKNMLLLVLK